ncbi:hypothetical protein FB45DRAFT_837193 [Roridomyces roridus]|uniref:Uncharacterized protein n=1 Tax=Roridomyces roridus TaxID=1738132 RepID=A0AAD7BJG7_9AGAR|nr:hypothetical protein FB45DRAFT_837193 [Roridomyces roridus]
MAARARDANADCLAAVSTIKLEAALNKVSTQAAQYEHQMKDLESKLSESLSNFRAIDSLLQEAFNGLRRNAQRADHGLNKQVAHITQELESSMESLTQLTRDLPVIQSQVADIRAAYDSGRTKAQSLVSDLTWLNTEFYERWRIIIFTSASPVSWRWRLLMRAFFFWLFLVFVYLTWIAFWGGYRAHRGGFMFGEKLMS